MERLVRLTFQCTDEMGDQVERTLVAELMGRTTNVYLLDAAGRILDCLRRVGLDDSAKRQACRGCTIRSLSRWSSAAPTA